MIACKIGGSSLRDTDSLKRVVEIIAQPHKTQKIIVLSAVKGVTDHLIKSIDEALKNDRKIEGLLEYLRILHRELIIDCIHSVSVRHRTMDEIEYLLSRLEKLLFGITFTGECTPRSRELVLSTGERLAVQVLAGCLMDQGVSAVALDADKIGIYATGEYGNGNADLAVTEQHLSDALDPYLNKHIIPVITGFFGRTHDNHTITFGRGGTDYSAAIVACAMNCTELQIWKDVDGFLTASPEIVPSAMPVKRLAYEEAAELSYFGAEILHPRTVEPLGKKNIPAVIKNTFEPDGHGTVISAEKKQDKDVIKSVSFNSDIGILCIYGAAIGQQIGFLKNIVSVLSDNHINIMSVITAQTDVNVLLAKRDMARSRCLIESLQIPYIDSIELVDDIAVVAVVGVGLVETKGLAARVFTSVAKVGTNVEMIVSGASKVAQYFIIKKRDVRKTIQAIHSEFFY